MMRLMGAVLVAAGGAALGFQAAASLQKRGRAVRQMEEGLALLERELELNAPPLSRLLERGAAHSGGPARALFQDCVRGLDSLDQEDFPSLWRRLAGERTELTAEGQAYLRRNAPDKQLVGLGEESVFQGGDAHIPPGLVALVNRQEGGGRTLLHGQAGILQGNHGDPQALSRQKLGGGVIFQGNDRGDLGKACPSQNAVSDLADPLVRV